MKDDLPLISRYPLARYLLALLAVAIATGGLLALRSWLSTPIIALLFLLPVMLAATLWGLKPALVASLAAFLAFNYFFLDPRHTLAISNPEELVALLVFLLVAVLVSQLVGTANVHAEQARARELEATTLYSLAQTLSAQVGLEETLSAITRQVAEAFDLAGCEIFMSAAAGAESHVQYWSPDKGRGNAGPAGGQVVDVPLHANQALVGTMRLTTCGPDAPILPATMRTLTTFAAQVGLFIERVNLARDANRARLLEESDRLKSVLLSSVSHDLRTPLSAIKASATVLLEQDVTLDPAARYDLLSTINEEADRLNRLVGNLLDMSRIEAGALKLECDWCDMDELIRTVVHRLSARLGGLRVQLDWPVDLPLVYADYVQIDRVVTNLLENAIRFAPGGSTLEITARGGPAEMSIGVANQGPAIPERALPHLFDKFYRIYEDRAPGMGTGLGLSICKGIVEAHGGRISVESPVQGNIGVRFVFTLPLAAAEAPGAGTGNG